MGLVTSLASSRNFPGNLASMVLSSVEILYHLPVDCITRPSFNKNNL
jgi:hypothetical protein